MPSSPTTGTARGRRCTTCLPTPCSASTSQSRRRRRSSRPSALSPHAGEQSSQSPLVEGDLDLTGSSSGSSSSSNTTFIPDKIYKMQSDWYHYVLQQYGLPLDSRHLYTKSDWEFFAAAITSKKTRKELLDSVSRWLNETETGAV